MEGRGLHLRTRSASRPQRDGSSGSLAARPAGHGLPRRASVLVVLILLAGVFLGTVTFLPAAVRGATLHVGGAGPGNWTVIQYAIENATAGDTVFVYAGRYLENVEVDKAISLVGEDRNTTIIDGRNQGTVVNITASGANVTGLTVTNGSSEGTSAGIVLAGVRACHVYGNNVTGNAGPGIYANSSANNAIEGNVVYANQRYGLRFVSSDNDTILGNEFAANGLAAIAVTGSRYLTVFGNVVPSGGGTHGIDLSSADWAIVANNTLGPFPPFPSVGVHLASSANVTVANNTIRAGGWGVSLDGSGRNTVERNTIVNSTYGIYLYGSSGNLVAGNDVSLGSFGIVASSAPRNTIVSNNVSALTASIRIVSSDGNTVANNTVATTLNAGVSVEYSRGDVVANNTIVSGGGPAIELQFSHVISVDRNAMTGGGVYLSGNRSDDWDTHSIAPSNTVNGRPVHYVKNATGGTVPAGSGQVILANCTGVTVTGQSLGRLYVAVEAGFSSGLIVSGNSMSNTTHAGLLLWYTVNSSIAQNDVSYSGLVGVWIRLSSKNAIANNSASYDAYGVFLDASDNNTLTGNTIRHNGEGIYSMGSPDNLLLGNDASDNSCGMCLGGARNSILNNTLARNSLGLGADSEGTIIGNTISLNGDGLAIGFLALNVQVYHNNFLNNANQTRTGGSAILDNGYPSGGNFWSDYRGVDNYSGPAQNQPGGDGIGDTLYATRAGFDRYPLMYPVTPPPFRPSRPQNLVATAGDRRVVLTWGQPATDGGSPITNYTVYRGLGAGPVTPLVDLAPVSTYTDSGLTAGQPYRYIVTARNVVGAGPVSNPATATPYTFAGAPQNLTAAGSNRQVVLSWLAPATDGFSPITNYTVFRGTVSGGETLLAGLGDVRAYTDTGLTNGVTYYYRVAAVNAAGEGPNSTEASATPIATPSEPLGLTATPGDAHVTLNWNPPATDGGLPITNYRVYRGTSPGSETFLVQLGAVLTYLDTGLTNGVTYYYTVAARNAAGEGPASNEAFATPVTVPGPPLGLAAAPGLRQIALIWSPPATNGGLAVTNYRVYRGPSPGTETFLIELGPVLAHIDAGLGDGQTFCYVVRAVNGVGEGPASFEACATTPSRPSAPVNLRAVGGDARIVLSWSPPPSDGGSPITGYRVYRGTASGAETPLLLLGAVLTYTDAGVSNGFTYYYEIAAVNAVGEGPVSGEASATAAARPSAPLALQAAGGTGRVTLIWSAPSSDGGSPIIAYRVYRGTTPGGESLLAPLGIALSYADLSVVGGRRYYYQVSAVNLAGEGPRSSEANGTAFMAPGVPRFPIATVAAGQIRLTWTPPSDDGGSPITGYRVYRGTQPGGETPWSTEGVVLSFLDAAASIGVTYYYQVSASNAAGEGPRSAEVRAVIANVPPVCAIGAPAQDTLVSGFVTVSGTAGDADGTVRRVEVRIDNGLWAVAQGTTNWTYSWDTHNVSDGTHTIWARSYDGLAYSQDSRVSVLLRNGPPPPPPAETPVWQQPWVWGIVGVLLVVGLLGYRLFRREEGKKAREKGREK